MYKDFPPFIDGVFFSFAPLLSFINITSYICSGSAVFLTLSGLWSLGPYSSFRLKPVGERDFTVEIPRYLSLWAWNPSLGVKDHQCPERIPRTK